jgi:hypothetical protein
MSTQDLSQDILNGHDRASEHQQEADSKNCACANADCPLHAAEPCKNLVYPPYMGHIDDPVTHQPYRGSGFKICEACQTALAK